METSRSALVIGDDGFRGRLVEGGVSDGRSVLVRSDTGQQLMVPKEALVPQSNGSYRLSIRLAELERYETSLSSSQGEAVVLPVVQEELEVSKRTVETGGVRVRKVVREHEETVDEPLLREDVQVERVLVNRIVEAAVPVRYEGDTLILPLLEEVLVVEKRLMLKEELRVTRSRSIHRDPQRFQLRSEEVIVERLETTPARDQADLEDSNTELQQERKHS